MEAMHKELTGKVVSAANNKTITVLVETYKLNHQRNMLFMMKLTKQKLAIQLKL